MTADAALQARSAIEALRAGVPNGAAIRLLGTNETRLEQSVIDHLRLCRSLMPEQRQSEGIVIAGAFGAGKSHQLGYIAELAKTENFIVSLVPISKETPLFDPARLFVAAIRAATVPQANDEVLTAVMGRLHQNEAYGKLEQWTTDEVNAGRLSPIFAALVHVIPRTGPDELFASPAFSVGASSITPRLRVGCASRERPSCSTSSPSATPSWACSACASRRSFSWPPVIPAGASCSTRSS